MVISCPFSIDGSSHTRVLRGSVMNDSFALLKEYANRFGTFYGTEDFCIFLYGLAKMQRPKVILELGTGFGVTTFWLARAVVENGEGHIWTVDNGSHWQI